MTDDEILAAAERIAASRRIQSGLIEWMKVLDANLPALAKERELSIFVEGMPDSADPSITGEDVLAIIALLADRYGIDLK